MSLCPQSAVLPGSGAAEHVTWDADSKGSAEVTPDLGELVEQCHTPTPSGQSGSGIFITLCLSQDYMMVEKKGICSLFKKRLRKTMRHNKMNWLEKIIEHAFLHKSCYIKNM